MIKKQQVKTRKVCKVTFELPADFEADAVHLVAEFNGWQEVPFNKQKSGKWKLVQEVEPGHDYQFRYRALHNDHDHYFNDPDADSTVQNDQGTENAVISC